MKKKVVKWCSILTCVSFTKIIAYTLNAWRRSIMDKQETVNSAKSSKEKVHMSMPKRVHAVLGLNSMCSINEVSSMITFIAEWTKVNWLNSNKMRENLPDPIKRDSIGLKVWDQNVVLESQRTLSVIATAFNGQKDQPWKKCFILPKVTPNSTRNIRKLGESQLKMVGIFIQCNDVTIVNILLVK